LLEPQHEEFSNHLGAFSEANLSYSKICNSIVRTFNDLAVWFDQESGISSEKKLRLIYGIDQITSRYSEVANQDYYSAIGIATSEWQQFINVVRGKKGDVRSIFTFSPFFCLRSEGVPPSPTCEKQEWILQLHDMLFFNRTCPSITMNSRFRP
jgi:hypothetical protein